LIGIARFYSIESAFENPKRIPRSKNPR
jgi:hypothetical protein